jgi:hypothetical protein
MSILTQARVSLIKQPFRVGEESAAQRGLHRQDDGSARHTGHSEGPSCGSASGSCAAAAPLRAANLLILLPLLAPGPHPDLAAHQSADKFLILREKVEIVAL